MCVSIDAHLVFVQVFACQKRKKLQKLCQTCTLVGTREGALERLLTRFKSHNSHHLVQIQTCRLYGTKHLVSSLEFEKDPMVTKRECLNFKTRKLVRMNSAYVNLDNSMVEA